MWKSLLVVCALAACGGKTAKTETPPTPVAEKTLFERLGGQASINAVVHEFVLTTGSDPRIQSFFIGVKVDHLEQMMDEHICKITGGGCDYTGKEMLEAHTNMKVTEDDFAAFMDDLEKTLTKLNVGQREKDEVLAAFNGLKADVVGH